MYSSFPGLDYIKLFTTDIMHIGYIGIVILWIELTYPILSDVIEEEINFKFKNIILARKDRLVEFVNKFDERISMSFLPVNKGKLPNKFLLDGDLWVPLLDPRQHVQ